MKPSFRLTPRAYDDLRNIAADYYCFPQGSHLIFYLIGKDVIDIIGVPHMQMDVPAYFGEVDL